ATACRAVAVCAAGACRAGDALPDGTACTASDPCDGHGECAAGVCRTVGDPEPLVLEQLTVRRTGAVDLRGSIRPGAPVAPESSAPLVLELRDGDRTIFSAAIDHPVWKRRGRRL